MATTPGTNNNPQSQNRRPTRYDLKGTNGDDVLQGGEGDDQLDGRNGNDLLLGAGGEDELKGGKGNDTLEGGAGDDQLGGEEGNDRLVGGEGDDEVHGGQGDDLLDGGAGDDDLAGGNGEDQILGGAGNDRLDGGQGDDTLEGGVGNDRLEGGSGRDLLEGGAGSDRLEGGAGNDTVQGGEGNDQVRGESGNDQLDGGAGWDRVEGGSGDDLLVYNVSANLAIPGDEYLGGSGVDTLRLDLSHEQWMREDFQAEIAAYQANLAAHPGRRGDDEGGRDSYDFQALGLTARGFERLEVTVDGVGLDPADDPVVANDDAFTTGQNSPITGNVTANDQAPDLIRQVTLLSQSQAGDLSLGADGSFTYDPGQDLDHLAQGETATVSFDYQLTDADGDTDTATARLTLTGANDAPVVRVVSASGAVTEDGQQVVSGQLTATDVDHGSHLTWSIEGGGTGTYGSITVDEAGQWTYTLLANNSPAVQALGDGESQTETFTVQVSDGIATVSQEVTIAIAGTNDGPVAAMDLVLVQPGVSSPLDVLANDTDVDGDALRITSVQSGQAEITPDGGGLLYTPEWSGSDVVTYTVQDETGASSTATALVVIGGVAGGPGDDVIDQSAATEDLVIVGGVGDDQIASGSGNDIVLWAAGQGNDTIDGGAGFDRVSLMLSDSQFNEVEVQAVDGTVAVTGPDFSLTIDGVEELALTSGPAGSSITLGDLANTDIANDTVIWYGGAGNDFFNGAADAHTQQLTGNGGDDTLFSGAGNDQLYGNAGDDYLRGHAGTDSLFGGDGGDDLSGDAGNDILTGGAGIDELSGGDGDDTLVYDINDALSGGTGFDTVVVSGHALVLSTDGARLQGIEALDLRGYGVNSLGLDPGSVAALSDESDTLRVYGDSGDQIIATGDWTQGSATADGFAIYTSGSARLEVQSGVSVVRPANGEVPPPSGGYKSLDELLLSEDVVGGLIKDAFGTLIFEAYTTENELKNSPPGRMYGRIKDIKGFYENMAAIGEKNITLMKTVNAYMEVLNSAKIIYNFASGVPLVLQGTDKSERLDWGTDQEGVEIIDWMTHPVSFLLLPFGRPIIAIGNGGNDVLGGYDGFSFGDHLWGWGDVLDGGAGVDTMRGGAGDDIYFADGGDVILESASAQGGIDIVIALGGGLNLPAGVEHLFFAQSIPWGWWFEVRGNELDNVMVGNSLSNQISGAGGDDQLVSSGGNDTLDGGEGSDTMWGGPGEHIFVVDSLSDVVIEGTGASIDTIRAWIDYDLGWDNVQGSVENLVLLGAADIKGIGNDLDNHLEGNQGANLLQGLSSDDTLRGGADSLYGNDGADTLDGGEGDDTYYIGPDDVIRDSDGYDVAYTYAASGNLIHDSGGNIVAYTNTAFSYTLPTDAVIEELVLQEVVDRFTQYDDVLPNQDMNATGGAGNNKITGSSGNNILTARGGSDTLIGGAGNDTLSGDDGRDYLSVGYAGSARMEGGTGNNTYVLMQPGDVIVELASQGTPIIDHRGDIVGFLPPQDEGIDTATSGVVDIVLPEMEWGRFAYRRLDGDGDPDLNGAYDIREHAIGTSDVENIILTGTADLDGIGNLIANTIIGNEGDNTLDGGMGVDTIRGGAGDDLLVGGPTQGAMDDLRAIGLGVPGYFPYYPYSITDRDVLETGVGIDTLRGGADDDTYIARDTDDVIQELPGEGRDLVQAWVSYTLPDTDVENLELYGSATAGTGNALPNVITGNDLDNILDGVGGIDIMKGGLGNDTYLVDSPSDVVEEQELGLVVTTNPDGSIRAENLPAGHDTVRSSASSYTLSNFVEDLVLAGTGNINGIGNDLANTITGNVGNNILAGGNDLSQDTLAGGEGDDIYEITLWESQVNGAWMGHADVVIENSGEGIDTLRLSGSRFFSPYFIPANVERFEVVGPYGLTVVGDNVFGFADSMKGGAGDDIFFGESGNDTLDGGGGSNILFGEWDNDVYYVRSAGDLVVEGPQQGTDTVYTTGNYSLLDPVVPAGLHPDLPQEYPRAVENLVLMEPAEGGSATTGEGNALDNTLTGNGLNNLLTGLGGNDTLLGGAGNDSLDGGVGQDRMEGGAGDDTYLVDDASDVAVEAVGNGTDTVVSSVDASLANFPNIENLTLTGAAHQGTGNDAANVLTGNSSDNLLDGGLGVDTMVGGGGRDTFVVDNPGDVVTGTGIIRSSASYTLSPDSPSTLALTGSANLDGTGSTSGGERIFGNSGNNALRGGGGGDALWGGLGNDTYYFAHSQDLAIERGGGGIDEIRTPFSVNMAAFLDDPNNPNAVIGNTAFVTDLNGDIISITVGEDIENVTLTGSAAVDATGNALANYLTGNSAANVLDGGAGRDTLVGGQGNDTYVTDGLDVIDEVTDPANIGVYDLVNGAGGHDTVKLTLTIDPLSAATQRTYVLLNGVEDLIVESATKFNVVTGNNDPLRLGIFGNELGNRIDLNGNGLNDTIDGRGGGDTMVGGDGNDTYFVDHAGDVVEELGGGGHDKVNASVSFSLEAGVFNNAEDLQLTGSDSINATGNFWNNQLLGNSGNNVLDGGLGYDTMTGGVGADTFVVDAYSEIPGFGDVVQEGLDAAIDTVQSYARYWSLNRSNTGDAVENLSFMTGGDNQGIGNARNNVLTGNSGDDSLSGLAGNDTLIGAAGNDALDGGTGNDRLEGGAGDDTYTVDAVGDTAVEAGNEGIDTVNASADSTLLANVEHLNLTGTANLGTGNELPNTLTGNAGNNVLDGKDGADSVSGGAGDDVVVYGAGDTLSGGSGHDQLRVDGAGVTIDLTAEVGTRLQGFEQIDLTGSGDNTLSLDKDALLALSGESDTLRVLGNQGDRVIASGSWAQGDSFSEGGKDFDTYFSGDAVLELQAGVSFVPEVSVTNPADIAVGSLDGSTGFELHSSPADSWDEVAVAAAGDLNGDGLGDLVVGVPRSVTMISDGEGTYAAEIGRAFVVFGQVGSFGPGVALDALDGTNGFALNGQDDGHQLGASVAAAGDVNGDGIGDLIAGADGAGDLFQTQAWSYSFSKEGTSFVVYGTTGGFGASIDAASLDGTNGFSLQPEGVGAQSGRSVAGIGDFNGDGFADFVISGHYKTQSLGKEGAAYVVFGTGQGSAPQVDLEALDGENGFEFTAADRPFAEVGNSVSSAGDLNGDGFGDLIVGSLGSAGSFVVFGGPNSPALLDASQLNGANGFRVGSLGSFYNAGLAVSGAGDVNGDGFDDLLIGGYHGAWVVFGKEGGFPADVDLSQLDGSDGFALLSAEYVVYNGYSYDLSRVGSAVAGAGDVNGDGFDDLIVGAPNASPNGTHYAGAAYVVFGGPSFAASFELSALDGNNGYRISGGTEGGQLGSSVAGAGDLNGDGFADVVVGEKGIYGSGSGGYDGEGSYGEGAYGEGGSYGSSGGGGKAYVIYGRGTGQEGIIGTAGADLLNAGPGDVVRAGSGDDSIQVIGTDFIRLDGGGGKDTLALTGNGVTLDFSNPDANSVRGIEVIGLGNGGNTLRLSFLQAGAMTDGNMLQIDGDAGVVALIGGNIASTEGGYTTYVRGGTGIRVADTLTVQIQGEHVFHPIQNGSFEVPEVGTQGGSYGNNSNFEGWTVKNGGIDILEGLPAAEGDQSVDLNGSSPGRIEQTFDTTAGAKYEVRFDLSKNTALNLNNQTAIVAVSAGGESGTYTFSDAVSSADMKWAEHTLEFTADGPSTTLSFESLTDIANYPHFGPLLDHVEVVRVIEHFDLGGSDVLDLRGLLPDSVVQQDQAFSGGWLDFEYDANSGNTVVLVDANGGGNDYVPILTLVGVELTESDTANYLL